MPLTAKGQEILKKMRDEYGEKKGEEVFYASINAGTITGADSGPIRFHTNAIISQNLSLTPEGFLVCKHVPIARTGDQIYYEGEVPITPDQNGSIVITRDPGEVFNQAAMASFEGKPVTFTHPEDEVTPDTWKDVAIGHLQNIRKGDGLESDALYADLLIMDKDAIKSVLDREIREVSCGYDADYEETSPGRGRQLNIRGNHVALVEKGRCGALCAIHDRKGDKSMKGLFKKLIGSLSKDEQKEFRDVLGTADAALTTDQRLDRMEKNIATLARIIKDASEEEESEEEKEKKRKEAEDARAAKDAKDAEEEKKKKEKEAEDCKSRDAAYMATDAAPVFQEVLYRSSILAPELSRPTADSIKGMAKKSFDESCCLLKRKSLDAAYKTEEGKKAIDPFLGGKQVDFFTVDCAVCDLAFVGASEVLKKSGTHDRVKRTVRDFGGVTTVSALNERYSKFWQRNKGGN